jgi:CubicO group peptidase (beta-lactamase class C family)
MMRLYARVSKPLFLLLGLCLGLIYVPFAAADGPIAPHALEAFFDDVLAQQMAEEHVVGATVAVVQDGALTLAKGYGYADLDTGQPVEADRTLFYIGSAGKLFTWTAVMQLVEQGKLDLHADVNTYLDFEIPAAFGQPITLHHLMTHTAGFEEELRAMLADDPAGILPLREFLVRTMPQRIYPPREIFAYSNYGTALAGYIVERVSNVGYEQYITEHLLDPLGMTRSAAVQPLPAALREDMSKGYHYRNGRHDALDFEWVAAAPAAAIRGTATDLSQFMIAHLNDGCVEGACILRPETAADMHRQQFTHHPAMTGMAYGFVESQMNGQRILWHMGESARFVTVLALLPEKGVGLLVSYNTPPRDGRTVMFRFLDEFYSVDRTMRAASALSGWTERAREMSGAYVSSRVALHSPQKIIGWLDTLSLRAAANGALTIGAQHYVEVEPWLFHQQGGDRGLALQQKDGQTWLFWGPFAYRKVAWYHTLTFHVALVAACALVFVSGWLAWPLATWIGARRGHAPSADVRRARWLAAALGLLDLGLLGWFLSLMVTYGDTYAFPARTVDLVVRLNWLAAPLTLAVLVVAVRSWTRHKMPWTWNVHYTLIAISDIAFLWFLGFWNLLAGLPL